MGTFEVICYWKGKRQVRYYTVKLRNGIADRIYHDLEARGFRFIDVRLMA